MVYGFSGSAPWTLVSPVLLCCTTVQILSSVKWKRIEQEVNSKKLATSKEQKINWNLMHYCIGEQISRTLGSEMVTLWWRSATGQCSPQSCFSVNQLEQTLKSLLSKRETTSFLGTTGDFQHLLLPGTWRKLDTFQLALALREKT